MLTAWNKIRDFFATEKQYDNPDARADYYLSSLRLFKDFLDKKYPTLAQDWSGKPVSTVYLRSDFRTWMQRQKKSNGERYSPNTVNAYIIALKMLLQN